MTERKSAWRAEPLAADSTAGTLKFALACAACMTVALFADPGGPTH